MIRRSRHRLSRKNCTDLLVVLDHLEDCCLFVRDRPRVRSDTVRTKASSKIVAMTRPLMRSGNNPSIESGFCRDCYPGRL